MTGTQIEESKCEGPATQLTFLGLELDTQAPPSQTLGPLASIRMEENESMHKAGSSFPDRLSFSCKQGSESW